VIKVGTMKGDLDRWPVKRSNGFCTESDEELRQDLYIRSLFLTLWSPGLDRKQLFHGGVFYGIQKKWEIV